MNKCQGCENGYSIDLLIPNELWDQIKPDGKAEGAGLLCGSCIIKRMEKILVYACYKIVLVK